MANEATDIINALEREAKERSLAGKKINPHKNNFIGSNDKGKTVEKLAELFPTNTQYIQEAKRIKREMPEEFAYVLRRTRKSIL